jgi:acid phosphatase (class A)
MLRSLALAAVFLLALSAAAHAEDEGSVAELRYLRPSQVELSKILTAPPKPGSRAERRDLAISLWYQKRRTPAMIALARDDQDRSVFRFGSIFGAVFTEGRLPKSAAFFASVLSDERTVGAEAKKFWSRPRPFVTSTLIHPCVDEPPTNSYPSNHATTGMLYAQILVRMLPGERARIFARAAQYAKNRVICGVHYESDIEAGERAGAIEAQAMFMNSAFRRDFDAARAEIRAALALRR